MDTLTKGAMARSLRAIGVPMLASVALALVGRHTLCPENMSEIQWWFHMQSCYCQTHFLWRPPSQTQTTCGVTRLSSSTNAKSGKDGVRSSGGIMRGGCQRFSQCRREGWATRRAHSCSGGTPSTSSVFAFVKPHDPLRSSPEAEAPR